MNGINATLKDGRITCDDCERLRTRLAAAERERDEAREERARISTGLAIACARLDAAAEQDAAALRETEAERDAARAESARLAKQLDALTPLLRDVVAERRWTRAELDASHGGADCRCCVHTLLTILEESKARAALAGEETKSSERVCDFCGTCMVDELGAFVVCPVCGEEKCTATCIPAGNGTTCLDCEDRQTAEEPKP